MLSKSSISKVVIKKLFEFLQEYSYKYDSKALSFLNKIESNYQCIQIREDGKFPLFKMYYICSFICPEVNKFISPILIPRFPENYLMYQTIQITDYFILDKYPGLGIFLLEEDKINNHIELAKYIFINDYIPWHQKLHNLEDLNNLLNIELINKQFVQISEILTSVACSYLVNSPSFENVLSKRYSDCISLDQKLSEHDDIVIVNQKKFYLLLEAIDCKDLYPQLLKKGGKDIR